MVVAWLGLWSTLWASTAGAEDTPTAEDLLDAQEVQVALDVAHIDLGEPATLSLGGRISMTGASASVGMDAYATVGYLDKDGLVGGKALLPSMSGDLTFLVALSRTVRLGETRVPVTTITKQWGMWNLEQWSYSVVRATPVRRVWSLRAGAQGHQVGLPDPDRQLRAVGGHAGIGFRRDRFGWTHLGGAEQRMVAGTATAYLDMVVLAPVWREGDFEQRPPIGARIGHRWRMVRNTGRSDTFAATVLVEAGIRPWGEYGGIYGKLGVGGSIGGRWHRRQ